MKNLALGIVVVLLALTIAIPASAQTGPGITVAVYNGGSDYCQNPSIAKTSIAVNIGSATTTELVAAAAGKKVYVCKFSTSVVGTAPTLLFKTGTKVTNPCDTGTASLSGTYAITTGTMFELSANAGVPLVSTAAGEMCVTSGGTGPSIQGVMVYVQR